MGMDVVLVSQAKRKKNEQIYVFDETKC